MTCCDAFNNIFVVDRKANRRNDTDVLIIGYFFCLAKEQMLSFLYSPLPQIDNIQLRCI